MLRSNTTQSMHYGDLQQGMITTPRQTSSVKICIDQLQYYLAQLLTHEVVQRRGLKVFTILHSIYVNPVEEQLILSGVPLPI